VRTQLIYYYLVAILFFLIVCSALNAQKVVSTAIKGTIKGVVVDSNKVTNLSFVTISVKELGTDRVLNTALSDEGGFFEVKGIPYTQCRITFTAVGYKSKTIELPSFTSSIIFVGKIPLASNVNHLAKVKVVANKLLVHATLDKLTYDVAADSNNRTISALDMFRKVPLVTVDAVDNINLNGSDNFKVLINGRSSSLFVNNVSDVFKSMTAQSIKSVEVITNPSAKYESEGVAGIINVITYRKTIDGYNGSVNFTATSPTGLAAGGYLTYKVGRFGFSGNFGTNQTRNPTSKSNFFRIDKRWDNRFEQEGESNSKNKYGYISGELIYELTHADLITGSFSRNAGGGVSDFFQNARVLNSSSLSQQEYRNINNSQSRYSGNDFGIDYQRSFKKSNEQLLTFSYQLNTNHSSNNMIVAIEPIINYKRQQSISDNTELFRESSFQADYVHPVKKSIIELGVKSISRYSSSNFSYKSLDSLSNFFLNDSTMANKFDYKQMIYAAYISFTFKKENWSLKAGSRLEGSIIGAEFKSSGTNAKSNYLNLIPNVSISRKLKRNSFIRFSYNRRIERPSIYYLDPFIDLSDPRNIFFGNPKLNPANSNVFNLSYTSFIKGISINAALLHHFTNNSILRFTTLASDTVAQTTFGNIGRDQATGVTVSGSTTLAKKLSVSLNSNNRYVKFASSINGKPEINEGFVFNLFLNGSYRFNNTFGAGGNISYNSPSVIVQGRRAPFISHSLSSNKSFLKDDKLTASFSMTNPFQNTRRIFTETTTDKFYQLQRTQLQVRRFNITLNYRFGKLQQDVPRKKRGIKNDDLKATPDH
jgi:hypothetical protein